MSLYNPGIHNRRSIRFKGYDYSQAGLYFITICCHERNSRFGEIINGEMILNEIGSIAYEQWVKLAERFVNFELDVFQIMPDHMHAIVSLTNVGATLAVVPDSAVVPDFEVVPDNNAINIELEQQQEVLLKKEIIQSPTIGSIIGAYKSIVSNEVLKIYKLKNQSMGKFWQRNYYEHIIRDYEAYVNIVNFAGASVKRSGTSVFLVF